MTLVLVDKDSKGRVVMGADSQLTSDTDKFCVQNAKVRIIDNYVIGYCGESNLGEAILDGFKFPASDRPLTGRYMHTKFRSTFLDFLKAQEYLDSNGHFIHRGVEIQLLIGQNGKVWELSIDNPEEDGKGSLIGITECRLPYAIGSGSSYGMGAYSALTGSVKDKIKKSITITANLCTSVGGSVIIKREVR